MVPFGNIGTNTFGADILRIKRVQIDVVILERIDSLQRDYYLAYTTDSPKDNHNSQLHHA